MVESQNSETEFSVLVAGCDEIRWQKNSAGQHELQVIGCSQLLHLIRTYQAHNKDPRLWSLPVGTSHYELLLKEFILRLQGQWSFPYQHHEICHCRMISTNKVDQAILCGAHQLKTVQRLTSASTACGTCHQDICNLINYRLQT